MEYTSTLWIGNISNNITERDLVKMFDKFSKYIFKFNTKQSIE